MKKEVSLVVIFLSLLLFVACSQPVAKKVQLPADLEIVKISDNVYMHRTYLQTQNFGKVGANGLILVDGGEAYLLDTPWNNEQTEQLVQWIADSLKATVTICIPTHWHEDCMGGLEYLQTKGVQAYANQMTINIAKEKGLALPQHGFTDSLSLRLHDIDIHCYYLGGGHTTDNIVIWIPSQKLLFGGCPVKDISSSNLGNLADADVKAWAETMKKMSTRFSGVEIVVPGHGEVGGIELFGHTLKLLEDNE